MKKRHLLMSVSLVVAAWFAFFGDKSPDTGSVELAARRPAMPPAFSSATAKENSMLVKAEPQDAQGEAEARILALQPRADLMDVASNDEHKGDGLFSSKVWVPPPPPKSDKPEPPPPPPMAPPLPFTYLGKQLSDGQIEVYLARGDEVLVVRDQTVIQNTYRVQAISPPTLSLVYLPLNQIQQLPIGVTN